MTKYLLDTNILLRASDPNSSSYLIAMNAVDTIIKQGGECFITSQNLIEFWVVATRPTDVNGLGWTTSKTSTEIGQILTQFSLLSETPDIFTNWLQLVTDNDIKGKRTHDIRLLAVMKVHSISHLLTFNPDDFIQPQNITIVHPQDIIIHPK
jgi:predicted nucleic acid-binding protein